MDERSKHQRWKDKQRSEPYQPKQVDLFSDFENQQSGYNLGSEKGVTITHPTTGSTVIIPAKSDVNIKGLSPDIEKMLVEIGLDLNTNYQDLPIELVITSGLEGEHSKGSKHYSGQAVDIRISDDYRSKIDGNKPWDDPMYKYFYEGKGRNILGRYGMYLIDDLEHGDAPHIHIEEKRERHTDHRNKQIKTGEEYEDVEEPIIERAEYAETQFVTELNNEDNESKNKVKETESNPALQALLAKQQERQMLMGMVQAYANQPLVSPNEDAPIQMSPNAYRPNQLVNTQFQTLEQATGLPQFQDGGKVNPRVYEDLLRRNQNVPFVKRIADPTKVSPLDRGNGEYSTHSMAADVDEDGQWYVYPTVVEIDGVLVDLKDRAFDYAKNNNNYIKAPSADVAIGLSENYKNTKFAHQLFKDDVDFEEEDVEERLVQYKEGGIVYRGEKFSGYNKPKRTPNHKTKSHAVLAKEGNKTKLIRFGQQGVSGAGSNPKTEKGKKRQKSFKARHAENIKKGKMSAAYWADKVKWEDGGVVTKHGYEYKREGDNFYTRKEGQEDWTQATGESKAAIASNIYGELEQISTEEMIAQSQGMSVNEYKQQQAYADMKQRVAMDKTREQLETERASRQSRPQWQEKGFESPDAYYEYLRQPGFEYDVANYYAGLAELTGVPSAVRVARDPIGTAKAVGTTIGDIGYYASPLAWVGLDEGGINPVTGQAPGAGLEKTMDFVGVIPYLGQVGKLASTGVKVGKNSWKAIKAAENIASTAKASNTAPIMGIADDIIPKAIPSKSSKGWFQTRDYTAPTQAGKKTIKGEYAVADAEGFYRGKTQPYEIEVADQIIPGRSYADVQHKMKNLRSDLGISPVEHFLNKYVPGFAKPIPLNQEGAGILFDPSTGQLFNSNTRYWLNREYGFTPSIDELLEGRTAYFAKNMPDLAVKPSSIKNTESAGFKILTQEDDLVSGLSNPKVDRFMKTDTDMGEIFYKMSDSEANQMIDEALDARRKFWDTPEGTKRLMNQVAKSNPSMSPEDIIKYADNLKTTLKNTKNLNKEAIEKANQFHKIEKFKQDFTKAFKEGNFDEKHYNTVMDKYNKIQEDASKTYQDIVYRAEGKTPRGAYASVSSENPGVYVPSSSEGLYSRNFTGWDNPYAHAEHEINHIAQMFPLEKGTTHLDDELMKLTFKDIKEGDNLAKDLEYFVTGSRGSERTAFLAEVRANMMQKGVIDDFADKVTPKMMEDFYNKSYTGRVGSGRTRLTDLINPNDKNNFKILADVMNKLPAVTGLTVAGAVGASTIKNDNKAN